METGQTIIDTVDGAVVMKMATGAPTVTKWGHSAVVALLP